MAVFIIATVSFPFLKRDFEIPQPISVEFVEVAPITQTNKVAPKPEPKKEEPKKDVVKPPPAAKNTASEAVTPVKQPVKEEKEKKKDDTVLVDKAAPPEKKKTKEDQKKKEVTKEEPKKDFASVLKNLADPEDAPAKKPLLPDLKLDEKAAPEEGSNAPLGSKMTMREEDALRRQLEGCWNVPFGAKDAENLRVEIFMVINPDRTLREARIVDTRRYNSDTFFRAAAESAMRAVQSPLCSPFELPPDKYDVWKTVTVTFDPSQMF